MVFTEKLVLDALNWFIASALSGIVGSQADRAATSGYNLSLSV